MEELYSLHTLIFYLVGIVSFLISNIDDIEKKEKSKTQWIQYILFTLIAITIGIAICAYMDTKESMYWLVSISSGILGGTILSKIDNRKQEIGDSVVDSIKKRTEEITASDIMQLINQRTNNKTVNVLEYQENITDKIDIDDSSTYIDEEQSDYNPFENEH